MPSLAVATHNESRSTRVFNDFAVPDELYSDVIGVTEDGDLTELVFSSAQDPRLLNKTFVALSTNPETQVVSVESGIEGDYPRDAVFTVDGQHVLIAGRDSQNVLVYNVATHTVEAEIVVSGPPVNLAATPDGRYALSANTSGKSVSVIDLSDFTLAADIPLSNA